MTDDTRAQLAQARSDAWSRVIRAVSTAVELVGPDLKLEVLMDQMDELNLARRAYDNANRDWWEHELRTEIAEKTHWTELHVRGVSWFEGCHVVKTNDLDEALEEINPSESADV